MWSVISWISLEKEWCVCVCVRGVICTKTTTFKNDKARIRVIATYNQHFKDKDGGVKSKEEPTHLGHTVIKY